MKVNKIVIITTIVAFSFVLAFFAAKQDNFLILNTPQDPVTELQYDENLVFPIAQELQETPAPEIDLEQSVLHVVPFTPQAPFGNWADARQSYACEEASVFMAVSWARGESFTPAEAEQTVIAISEFEIAGYGDFRDTSAQDTLSRIIKGYFGFDNAWIKEEIDIEDIK